MEIENKICPITMEKIEFPKRLKCNHEFETVAIEQWLIDNNTCPVCRDEVYEKEYVKAETFVFREPIFPLTIRTSREDLINITNNLLRSSSMARHIFN
jgi:hypothetical protein